MTRKQTHKQRHEKAASDLESDFQKKLEFQNNQTAQKEKEINRLEGKLSNLEEEKLNSRDQICNGLNQMLLAYSRANQAARSSPAPKYFGNQGVKNLLEFFS